MIHAQFSRTETLLSKIQRFVSHGGHRRAGQRDAASPRDDWRAEHGHARGGGRGVVGGASSGCRGGLWLGELGRGVADHHGRGVLLEGLFQLARFERLELLVELGGRLFHLFRLGDFGRLVFSRRR